MDTTTLHARSVAGWLERVRAIGPGDWDRPTPCSEWSVRDLVNHLVYEGRWTGPLMQGRTMAEVGDQFEGDLLGADPLAAATSAADEATREVAERLPAGARVRLSYGEEDPDEYVRQLVADHVIHSWDLARAIGADDTLDAELVDEVGRWFADRADMYRAAGIVAAPVEPDAPGAQAELLAASGRDPRWTATRAAVLRLADAFGAGDVDAIMAAMSPDCVFEATSPPPDGNRLEGADAVRAVFTDLFTQTPEARFETEEIVDLGDRAVLRWRFSWGGAQPGHVRGIDLLAVRDGAVSDKMSYVKG